MAPLYAGQNRRLAASPGIKPVRGTIMGKGDKQKGNREAKKPKANKALAPLPSTFLQPQGEARKPAKPSK